MRYKRGNNVVITQTSIIASSVLFNILFTFYFFHFSFIYTKVWRHIAVLENLIFDFSALCNCVLVNKWIFVTCICLYMYIRVGQKAGHRLVHFARLAC